MAPGEIEFVCTLPDRFGDLPEPVPACDQIPEWYNSINSEEKTVRDCMPFFDALTAGWIIPFPFDVDVDATDGFDARSEAAGEFDAVTMFGHGMMAGEDTPTHPAPIPKWNSPWAVDAAPDTSLLVTAPINRRDPRFSPFTGLIDVDEYPLEINAPSTWDLDGYTGTIEAGTPMVQVIAVDRDELVTDATIRRASEDRLERNEDVREGLSGPDPYRSTAWTPKNGARVEVDQ